VALSVTPSTADTAEMTWQSGAVIGLACAFAAIAGFAVRRWLSIPVTVLGWVLYVRLIYPHTVEVVRQDRGFRTMLGTLSLLPLFGTSVLIGTATAAGWALRELAHALFKRTT
jgi:hypothetical protein